MSLVRTTSVLVFLATATAANAGPLHRRIAVVPVQPAPVVIQQVQPAPVVVQQVLPAPVVVPVAYPQTIVVDTVQRAHEVEAVQMEILRQRQAQFDATIRGLSNLQARHHETVMVIINNMRPTGRYEYNPVTGRYDRYVP